jgi:hypothetical protein
MQIKTMIKFNNNFVRQLKTKVGTLTNSNK